MILAGLTSLHRWDPSKTLLLTDTGVAKGTVHVRTKTVRIRTETGRVDE